MLVPMKQALDAAREGGYAVVNADVYDAPSTQAALDAAAEMNAPVIISWGDRHGRFDYFAISCIPLIRESKVKASLILDHSKSFELAAQAMKAGFNAVMTDYSHFPFEENLAKTVEVVRLAHALDVNVEAELGHVGYSAENDGKGGTLTDPEEARVFVERTGVDALAVAIGTIHGVYRGTPHLDYDRLEEIRARTSVPLVLHGGSGTGDEALLKAVQAGICKTNLFTDLCGRGLEAFKAFLAENDRPSSLAWGYAKAMEGFKDEIKRYMRLLGSEGKQEQLP